LLLRKIKQATDAIPIVGRLFLKLMPSCSKKCQTANQRIGSRHQMLAPFPARTLNHIGVQPGIPPIQKKSATL
jgi:hypothetical protein